MQCFECGKLFTPEDLEAHDTYREVFEEMDTLDWCLACVRKAWELHLARAHWWTP